MKHLKLLFTACMLVGSAQAFELPENTQHKAKAAGWATMLAANAAVAAHRLFWGYKALTNTIRISDVAAHTYLVCVTLGFLSKYAYGEFKKEYTLAFPKKDLQDEKA